MIRENARIKLRHASLVSPAEPSPSASHINVNYLHTVIFHNLYLIQMNDSHYFFLSSLFTHWNNLYDKHHLVHNLLHEHPLKFCYFLILINIWAL